LHYSNGLKARMVRRMAGPERMSAIVHALWGLVLLRLCCPPLWQWELALAAPVASPPMVIDLAEAREVAAPAFPRPSSERAPVFARSTSSWQLVLVWAWLCGSGVFVLIVVAGVLRFVRRQRPVATTPPRWIVEEVTTLAARMQIPSPCLVDDPRATSPFVWSFGRARLVLSSTALAAADRVERMTALAHELAHLRRRDHWFARRELLLATFLWWHPLFWLARLRMCEQTELACDAWALWALPEARFAYAGALIQSLHEEHPAMVPFLRSSLRGRRHVAHSNGGCR
jgi:bla regulator protein BlaR1